jgi:hypothetical protein
LKRSKILQTSEGNTEKNEAQPKEIPKFQMRDKDQLAKLVSYHQMTDVRLPMDEKKVVDGFRHSIFRSMASSILNWPLFHAFPIDNDEIRLESYN